MARKGFNKKSLIFLGIAIGFGLFYIGLNQWEHQKSSSSINIVSAQNPSPVSEQNSNQNQNQIPPNFPAQNEPNNVPQSTNQQNQPISSQNIPQSNKPQETAPPNTIEKTKTNTISSQKALNKENLSSKTENESILNKTIKEISSKNEASSPKNSSSKKEIKQTTSNNLVTFQLGAFSSQENALKVSNLAKAKGFNPTIDYKNGYYRVLVTIDEKEGIKLYSIFPNAFRLR